jgi:hypothetical protein
MFKLDGMKVPRQAFIPGARKLNFLFFLDASQDVAAVSVVVKNTLPNGKSIYRLLINKLRLNGSEVSSIPRAELSAALLMSRMKEIIMQNLQDYLTWFHDNGGEWEITVLSDSAIVISQIHSIPSYYRSWTASRLQEIRECCPPGSREISWFHVPTGSNLADICTREYYSQPSEICWLRCEGCG